MSGLVISVERGIPIIPLTGIRTVEAENDYLIEILLRTYVLDANNQPVDNGALVLRSWDPANQADPDGGGYGCQVRDQPGGTLLFAGAVGQNGVRAADNITLPGLGHDYSVVVTYPDLRDPTIAPPLVTRTYTWKDPATASPSAAGHLLYTGTALEDKQTLIDAINGTASYGDQHVFYGTEACKELVAVSTAGSTLNLEARDGGRWGNLVTYEFFDAVPASILAGTLSGGTGKRGIVLTFDHADMPNSKVGLGSVRHCAYDIVGLDSGGDPTKLVVGPLDLQKSNTLLSP